MAYGFPPGDPFHTAEARDGFHAVCVHAAESLTLYCCAYAGGAPVPADPDAPPEAAVAEVVRFDAPTAAEVGAVRRLHLAMSAAAMYLTTGGSWEELLGGLRALRAVAPGGLVFPGYHLVDTYLTTEQKYQHVFAKDGTEEAALWESPEPGESGVPVGGWIDSTTLTKIREQRENDDRAWGAGEGEGEDRGPAGEAEEGGQTALLRLPGPDRP